MEKNSHTGYDDFETSEQFLLSNTTDDDNIIDSALIKIDEKSKSVLDSTKIAEAENKEIDDDLIAQLSSCDVAKCQSKIEQINTTIKKIQFHLFYPHAISFRKELVLEERERRQLLKEHTREEKITMRQ
eukprot:c18796_g1_i1.p1 GENE.c18796_g1_i1~~c18796_g1_i1.p1  ORF type:complete len:129 (+),score=0.06 c18796_g1_i1:41-427(+)